MSRQTTLLLFLGAALLIVVGVITFRLRPVKIELPQQEPAQVARDPRPMRVESTPSDTRAAPVVEAPTPVPAAQPSEDLLAEGLRRGWQLPVGKGWWTDTLINPTGADPQGRELALLQERVLTHGDALLALKQQRKQRLDAYCQERIAAGLAVPDPQGEEVLPEGKQHVIVTTHTLSEPTRFWRVDVGPGEDTELDDLDRSLARTWISAVQDLRARIAAAQH